MYYYLRQVKLIMSEFEEEYSDARLCTVSATPQGGEPRLVIKETLLARCSFERNQKAYFSLIKAKMKIEGRTFVISGGQVTCIPRMTRG
jgi:hypothetical protein